MQPLRYTLATGQEARNFRKRLASRAVKPKKAVLTTKFRLDCPPAAIGQMTFGKIRDLYGVIEGTGPGTLTHLVFTLQTCGFRIFSKGSEAKKFASGDAYRDDEFRKAVASALGRDWPEFVPSGIVKRLEKAARASGGKDNAFTADVIAREYGKEFKASGDADREKVVRRMAEALASGFTSWKELKVRLSEACSCVDGALAQISEGIPAIAAMHLRSSSGATGRLPDNTTIAFDAGSIPYACDDDILPYCAVATAIARGGSSDAKAVQECITSEGKHNGLSWLLGTGLAYLQEHSVADIQAAYGVPDDMVLAAKLLKEAADAIPRQTALMISEKGSDTYAAFRQGLGGHLDSWLANYIGRLGDLSSMLGSIDADFVMPEGLDAPEGIRLLEGISHTVDDVRTLLETLNAARPRAAASLERLTGRGDRPRREDIRNVTGFSEQFNGLVSLREELANAIAGREKDGGDFATLKASLSAWKDFARFPKLNGLSGGMTDAVAELKADEADRTAVRAAYDDHTARVERHLAACPSLVSLQTAREEEKLDARPVPGLSALDQAVRFLLHRVGHTARMHPGPIRDEVRAWFLEERIFVERGPRSHAALNSYFINRRWPLYSSPFSTRRNRPYAIRAVSGTADAEALWEHLKTFVLSLRDKSSDDDAVRAVVRCVESLELTRLLSDIPADVAAVALPERFSDALPAQYAAELARGRVSANTFRRAFNAYASVLGGLDVRLRREVSYLRAKFTWCGNTALVYVPKDVRWSVPERYRAVPEWKELLESDAAVWDGDRLNVRATFEAMVKTFAGGAPSRSRDFLVQMPHDWCYRLPVAAPRQGRTTVLRLDKGVVSVAKEHPEGLGRLIGPSNLKSRIDALLSQGASGDMTILYDVMVRRSGDAFVHEAPSLSLAVPISEQQKAADDGACPFSRIVAIDQEEAGLAYAVFNLSDLGDEAAEPVTSGTVRIPSIRRLIRAGQGFRKGGQLVQKFNQRFDSTLFNMRENVAGDVCSVIEGLMHRFRAFPVLENEVRNLESGSKQLTLVYKAVNNRFLESDSDMPNAERAAWWHGAASWAMPGYRFMKNDGKTIPLLLYPGRGVAAADTSRICSVCRRNVFDALKDIKDKKVHVRNGGIVELPGGDRLKLYKEPSDPSLRAEYARKNLFTPMLEPVGECLMGVDELARLVRRNLRRRPACRQSRDTTQSVYYCVFEDCPSHKDEWRTRREHKGLTTLVERHADVNAAINIGRRFLTSDRILRDEGDVASSTS